ncbi:hypothetical protein MMC12_004577 [Toensbergia leucococca]|nr:hypothetical protein [Toensbergia leucococca]
MHLTVHSSFGVILGAIATSTYAASPNQMVCNNTVIARIPPQLGGPANPLFVDTPRGYFSGLWFETYSSDNDSAIRNVELISVYNVTADTTTDLTSYQLVGNCSHIYTIYATDADSPTQDDNYPLHLPGTNITVIDDVIAYGVDTNCHRYYVDYGPAPTPGLVIASQVQSGPTQKTLGEIKKALKNLGDSDIAALAKAIKQIPDDGTRTGLQGVNCGQACMLNQNAPNGTCPTATGY